MSEIIHLVEVRARRRAALETGAPVAAPVWQNDITICCAYARMMQAEHSLEKARLDFERLRDGLPEWWNCPEDHRQRVHSNNRLWNTYIALLQHIAKIPANTRGEASNKRHTIGRQWLSPDITCQSLFGTMREGCIRDDHLFPPSLKMTRPIPKTRRYPQPIEVAQ